MEYRAMDWPNAPVQEDVPQPPPDPGGKTGYDWEAPLPQKPEPKKEKKG